MSGVFISFVLKRNTFLAVGVSFWMHGVTSFEVLCVEWKHQMAPSASRLPALLWGHL